MLFLNLFCRPAFRAIELHDEALTLLILNLLLRFVVIRPLRELSAMADQVSLGNMDVAEVKVAGSDEVAQLASSFGRMRISLRKALAMLEQE